MTKEIMTRAEMCELFGLTGEEFTTLFPAPPSFTLAGHERYRKSEIDRWLAEIIKDQDQKKVIRGMELFHVAKEHLAGKRFPEAEKILIEAIAQDRTKADYQFNLGFALFQLGAHERAELSLRKALEMDPKAEWRDAATYFIGEIEKIKRAAAAAPAPSGEPAAAAG